MEASAEDTASADAGSEEAGVGGAASAEDCRDVGGGGAVEDAEGDGHDGGDEGYGGEGSAEGVFGIKEATEVIKLTRICELIRF